MLVEQERKAVAQLSVAGAIVEVEQLDPHRYSGRSRTLPHYCPAGRKLSSGVGESSVLSMPG